MTEQPQGLARGLTNYGGLPALPAALVRPYTGLSDCQSASIGRSFVLPRSYGPSGGHASRDRREFYWSHWVERWGLRYVTSTLAGLWFGVEFPYGTMIANLSGSWRQAPGTRPGSVSSSRQAVVWVCVFSELRLVGSCCP
jgi:hypothetical protein